MITGHPDHRPVELAAPDGARGRAVVDTTHPDAERARIDTELDGIVRATDLPTSRSGHRDGSAPSAERLRPPHLRRPPYPCGRMAARSGSHTRPNGPFRTTN
ncbi:hypothetical protein [Streptomyces sp. NPDC002602]|uniref:hypothetical protein n=1 Tax=Streptomyces sp. NPDC002602 TaxID=3364654 RepID=UPI0036947147